MNGATKNSILIVDDEVSNLMFLTRILGSDYRLYTAKDGQEALDKTRELRPDLILLDIVLPGISGYEVLGKLKQQPETKEIPVVVITGIESPEDLEYTLELGAADYITKPFGERTVKQRVLNQMIIVNLMRILKTPTTSGSQSPNNQSPT